MTHTGTHDGILVLMSILIGIFASYTALDLASRARASVGGTRRLWLGTASVAMGGGVWSMHFVAMLAFSMPGVEVSYDLNLTLLSLITVVFATAASFVMMALEKASVPRLVVAGSIMGLGVAAMHYIGMGAMRMPAAIVYDPLWLCMSILVAIGAATTALWLASRTSGYRERAAAALVMGSAIVGMHYTGMQAATFVAHAGTDGDASVGQTVLAVAVFAGTFLILLFSLMASIFDRRFARLAQRESDALLVGDERMRMLTMAEAMAGVGHWHLNTIDQSLFWSDEVYAIHGRPLGSKPTLQEALDAYHPDDRSLVQHHINTALDAGTPYTFKVRLLRGDGEVRHVVAHGQIEHGSDGHVVGMFGVFQDVTEQALSEAALVEARDAANAATRAKSAFLATMSHEIRTPMTGVLGMIELLKTDPAKEQRDRFFASLEQSANVLMTVLDNVLDYSKIEGHKMVLEAVDFDFRELAQTTLDLFHNAASEKGLLLAMSFPTATSRMVRGDPVRIQQVISNLVSNAIKFTAAGRIDLTIRANPVADDRQSWTVEVVDTGIGIPADRLAALFSPFVQVDESTTRRYGGTGLGLAISQSLIEAMGGRIGITSTEGEGSTFRFVIELPKGEAIQQAPLATVEPAKCALRVLLAEDNIINQLLVSAIVQKLGHDIVCVENGRKAVDAAAASRFDVILMDMQMPEMDGLAATRAIRASTGPEAAMPIIALTADASPERRRFYDNVGLTDFMTKPIDSQLLARKLSAISIGDDGSHPPARAVSADDDPVLDTVRLGEIEQAIGAANTNMLLMLLEKEARTRPGAIEALVGLGNVAVVNGEAHALRGAAISVGAVRLARAASAIEAADGDAARMKTALTDLGAAATATLDAIARRTIGASAGS